MQIDPEVLRAEYRKAVDDLNCAECWRKWNRQAVLAKLRKAMETRDAD